MKVTIVVTTKRTFRINADSHEEAQRIRADLEDQAGKEAALTLGPVAEIDASITFVDIRW